MPITSSGRYLAKMTVGVIAIAVLAVVVALLGSSDPLLLPEGSPEALVQDFILAVDDNQLDAAYGMLAPAVSAECSPIEFRANITNQQPSDYRVQLEDVSFYAGQDVDVIVSISTFSGSPLFDLPESPHQVRFILSQTSDDWVIVEAPWPFSGCPFVRPNAKPDLTPP